MIYLAMKSKNHRITKILLIIIFVLALYSIFYIPLPSENKINYSDIKKQEDFSSEGKAEGPSSKEKKGKKKKVVRVDFQKKRK